jgi:cell wall-associated NlpC family hydrolase
MANGRTTSPRIAAVLAAALVAAPIAGAQPLLGMSRSATSSPSVLAVPPSPTAQAAQADVLATQDLIDATSATLASVRTELFSATDPAAIGSLTAQQAQLQSRKTALVARLAVQQRTLVRLIAIEAQIGAATASQGTASTLALNGLQTPPLIAGMNAASLPAAGPTASQIDTFLGTQQSPLAGLGAIFVADGEAVGIDPRVLVAISGAETSFGTYGPSQVIHNPFGLGPSLRFPSWSAAIQGAANTLGGPLYRGSGLVTIAQIQARWAPLGVANDPLNLNNNWQANVGRYFADLGGNPAAPVITGTATQLLSLVPPPPAPGTEGPAAAQAAMGLLGVPNFADNPDGLTDAQLVQTVFQDQGVSLPATVAGLYGTGTSIAPLALRAGDAVFFGSGSGTVAHVGLYLGAGAFIHAPGPGQLVQIASLYGTPWRTTYLGARRY